jgi:type I restriction enzyme R subunit
MASGNQLEFLDLVIDHLTARGMMDPKLLYEGPFTDFDSNGVEGVFNSADAATLVHTLRDLEANAA